MPDAGLRLAQMPPDLDHVADDVLAEGGRLPAKFRNALTQCDVADFFAAENDDFDVDFHSTPYFLYVSRTRKWHRAHDNAGDWRCPYWSYASEYDPLPPLYARIIRIIRSLTEESSLAERRRALSHAFIAGVIRLLEHDERCVAEPWEVANNTPPRPVREQRQAKRDAEHRQAISDMLTSKRSPHR